MRFVKIGSETFALRNTWHYGYFNPFDNPKYMFGELYDCFALDLKRPLVWTPARLRAWPAACAVPASLS